jgi:hypothetical protein
MDPYNPQAPSGFGAAPPLPKPKRPKKPDPAARRMKHLDYVALMLGVDPPPPDADLPPPVGFRFPDPIIEEPAPLMMGQPPIAIPHHIPPQPHTGNLPGGALPPPITALPPSIGPVQAPPPQTGNPSRNKL